MEELPPKGFYRHFKGNLYEVINFARDANTQKQVVVYRALYGEYGLWVRDFDEFFETIESDGEKVQRFEYIEPHCDYDAEDPFAEVPL